MVRILELCTPYCTLRTEHVCRVQYGVRNFSKWRAQFRWRGARRAQEPRAHFTPAKGGGAGTSVAARSRGRGGPRRGAVLPAAPSAPPRGGATAENPRRASWQSAASSQQQSAASSQQPAASSNQPAVCQHVLELGWFVSIRLVCVAGRPTGGVALVDMARLTAVGDFVTGEAAAVRGKRARPAAADEATGRPRVAPFLPAHACAVVPCVPWHVRGAPPVARGRHNFASAAPALVLVPAVARRAARAVLPALVSFRPLPPRPARARRPPVAAPRSVGRLAPMIGAATAACACGVQAHPFWCRLGSAHFGIVSCCLCHLCCHILELCQHNFA